MSRLPPMRPELQERLVGYSNDGTPAQILIIMALKSKQLKKNKAAQDFSLSKEVAEYPQH
eukprot:1511636-Amphidinium_carterae.2